MTQKPERVCYGKVELDNPALCLRQVARHHTRFVGVVLEYRVDERAPIGSAVNVCGLQFGLHPALLADAAKPDSVAACRLINSVADLGTDELVELLNGSDELRQRFPRLWCGNLTMSNALRFASARHHKSTL